jgi:D-alanine-D-alanine ligase
MQRIRVAVIRGGPSSEYEVSLNSGKNVIDNLPDKYIPTDVFISKAGVWHADGISVMPGKLLQHIDVVFNALHGEYGEDGKIQQLLNQHGVKYTGSKALSSALAMNKLMTKEIYKKAGLKTPIHKVIKKGAYTRDLAHMIFKTFPIPAIIKPNGSGSSCGVTIVKSPKDIDRAIKEAFKYADSVLVEEFISGKEATCGVVDEFKNKRFYSLLPIEIIKPDENEFFDYDAKYSGKSKEICPGNFSKKESEMIQDLSIKAHDALGLRHYSRSDFIINPKRGIYILETNTLPGLTKESLIPKALKAVGSSLPQFLDHVITLALND